MEWNSTYVGGSDGHKISYKGDLGDVVKTLDTAWNQDDRLNSIYSAARSAEDKTHDFKLNGTTYTIKHTNDGYEIAKKFRNY